MAKCKVIMDFYDKDNKEILRKIGDEFDVSEERFKELSDKKLVEKVKEDKPVAEAGVTHEKSTKK